MIRFITIISLTFMNLLASYRLPKRHAQVNTAIFNSENYINTRLVSSLSRDFMHLSFGLILLSGALYVL